MNLQTKVKITLPKNRITHDSSLLFIGSCFTENIGNLLTNYKFATIINPCGIAYNPISVANSIAFLFDKKKINEEKDLVFCNEKWHSLHHHGRFSNADKQTLLRNIENEITLSKEELASFSHIFLTLGTAWVFVHIETGQIVNNCHKIPANSFRRRRLMVAEITAILSDTISQIRQYNPTAEIIFTVSPIRHIKDGLHENQISKATLLLAIEELQNQHENIGYFPAYEIALDELRDYRFFAEDFCHLNTLGIEYISELFFENYIASESLAHFPALNKLQKALNHRIENPNSETYLAFQQKILEQIARLEKLLPKVDFSAEKLRLSISSKP